MSHRDLILAANPLAYYTFDELVGTLCEDVASTHDGLHENTPLLGVTSLLASGEGKAIQYRSVQSEDTKLTTLGSLGSNLLTSSVEFLVKTPGGTGPRAVFGTVQTGSSMIYGLYLNSTNNEANSATKLCLHGRDSLGNNTRFEATVPIYDDLPHHVMWVVESGNSHSLYIDGVGPYSLTQDNALTLGATINFDFAVTVGARNVRGTYDRFANEQVDELAFYTQRLTAQDAAIHAESALAAASRLMMLV